MRMHRCKPCQQLFLALKIFPKNAVKEGRGKWSSTKEGFMIYLLEHSDIVMYVTFGILACSVTVLLVLLTREPKA